MNISGIQIRQFEACQKKGFVNLIWTEGLDELTGEYGHSTSFVGNKILVRAFIVQKEISPPKTKSKKFEVKVTFITNEEFSEVGVAIYISASHFEYNLEDAMLYARWQATILLNLIGG